MFFKLVNEFMNFEYFFFKMNWKITEQLAPLDFYFDQ